MSVDGKIDNQKLISVQSRDDTEALHDSKVLDVDGKGVSVQSIYEAKPYTIFLFLRHFL